MIVFTFFQMISLREVGNTAGSRAAMTRGLTRGMVNLLPLSFLLLKCPQENIWNFWGTNHVVSWSCDPAEAWFCPDSTPFMTLSSQKPMNYISTLNFTSDFVIVESIVTVRNRLRIYPVFIPFRCLHCAKQQEKYPQRSLSSFALPKAFLWPICWDTASAICL